MEIVAASPAVWPLIVDLFSEGGDPKWCWCAYWRVRGLSWSNSTAAENQGRLRALVDAADADAAAVPPGLVALDGDRVVGWVAVGPRESYERLAHSTLLAPLDDRPAWAITCLVVGRTERGKGVARRLLEAAVEFARVHGATLVEGYPVDPGGGRLAPGSAYTGTRSMFEGAGFAIAAERRRNATTRPRMIMRRELDPPG